MKALSVSLNFNPGHFSHLVASYRLLEELGFHSEMLVAPEFALMDKENHFIKNYELCSDKVACAVFWFPSLKNLSAIRKLKRQGCKVLYVFHEPFDSIAEYRRGGFGWLKIAKISAINLVNILTLKMSLGVILPSARAKSLYAKNYKNFNGNFYQIPLLFDDECSGNLDLSKKTYISYIGTVAEDHAFDKFIDFVEYSVKNNFLPNHKFLIATKSDISAEARQRINHPRVEIIEGRPLTNKEINAQYYRSAIVWNAYNRSMQSGVLPKAFMFGTPVLSSQHIYNENFANYSNGISIQDNGNPLEINKALSELVNNLEKYSSSARETFLKEFYYKNYISNFREILKNQQIK